MRTATTQRLGLSVLSIAMASALLGRGAEGSTSLPQGAATRPETVPQASSAASLQLDQRLKLDPDLIAGQLENGLRYFVRRNHKPEQRAEIWLIVNAGSVQEDDDQRGLAHFVEHMAFNGTRHFEKQQLVDYLERIGMRFGPEINAYTSFDETVYMLTLPTDDHAVLERGFLILEDWAHGVAFEADDIDAERGVVVEEWRLGRGAQARMADRQLPILFQGSRYAERAVIGLKSVIEGAPHDTLRRFYRDWYRPDLMAVVAVGDFEIDAVSKLIRDHFGRLRGPETPRPREEYPVPDHDETLWAIATDPEATATTVAVFHKLEKRPEQTVGDYRRMLAEDLYHAMVNARLDELRQRPQPPFLYGSSSTGTMVRSRDLYFQSVVVPEGGLAPGLEALLTEVERVNRHGFTETELERAKVQMLRSYEQAYRERDKRTSGSHASEIRRHFLTGEPVPGIARERELADLLLTTIGLEELNHLADEWISEDNRVIAVSAPEKEGLEPPQAEALQQVFAAVQAKPIDPYVDRVRDEPLVAERPDPGTITSRKVIDTIGVEEWTLSNGVRVVLKPSDFKNDEILLTGFSPGGHSLVPDEKHTSALVAVSVLGAGGLGPFDRVELRKALSGKVAGGSVFIDELEEGFGGGASPEDLETLFQLLYLQFTAPKADAEAFESWMERSRGAIENRLARPETVFGDRMSVALAQGHQRRRPVSPELLSEIDLDVALEVYRDRFADAGDFTFIMVGNFELSKVEPLVLSYLGGLPSTGRQESWLDVGVRPPDGVVEVEVRKGLEPKSLVRIVFTGEAEWTRENHHDMVSLGSVLRMRLRELLREDMGGTYGVSVGGAIATRPRPSYSFSISFGCSPDNVDAMVKTVMSEIERAIREGFEDSYLAKVKQAQRRQRETSLKENGFWRGVLASYYRRSEDPRLIMDYEELVEQVSSERLQAAASRYLNRERYVLGTLRPESAGGTESQ